jgi:hypothetical protein
MVARDATPWRATFSCVLAIAAGLMSAKTTFPAPRSSAKMPSTPLPHPISSTRPPCGGFTALAMHVVSGAAGLYTDGSPTKVFPAISTMTGSLR